ncbi:MAG: hypothetical protein NZL87_10015, partial [Thermomicrobium sp.]|nr:hypothetical protein [Thermomicrobium sp.]
AGTGSGSRQRYRLMVLVLHRLTPSRIAIGLRLRPSIRPANAPQGPRTRLGRSTAGGEPAALNGWP